MRIITPVFSLDLRPAFHSLSKRSCQSISQVSKAYKPFSSLLQHPAAATPTPLTVYQIHFEECSEFVLAKPGSVLREDAAFPDLGGAADTPGFKRREDSVLVCAI
ncbi:MAG: hypothetical protein ABIW76_12620 [Fibrobacteria bacterium]